MRLGVGLGRMNGAGVEGAEGGDGDGFDSGVLGVLCAVKSGSPQV